MTEFISIAVPIFKPNVHHLNKALQSIQNQHIPAEIIVVDDGCDETLDTDRINELVQSFGGTYIRNSENLGMARNWNKAVRCSSGDLVLVLGQDDELENDALTQHVAALHDCTDAVLSGGGRRFIDSEGHIITPSRMGNDRSKLPFRQDHYCYGSEAVATLSLSLGNIVGEPSAVLFRRSVFDMIGGYNERLQHAADLDFNLRASEKGLVSYNVKSVLRRRLHEGNLTLSNISNGVVAIERRLMHEQFISRVSNHALRDLCLAYVFLNECKEMAQAIKQRAGTNSPRKLRGIGMQYFPENPVSLFQYVWAVLLRRPEIFHRLYGDLI